MLLESYRFQTSRARTRLCNLLHVGPGDLLPVAYWLNSHVRWFDDPALASDHIMFDGVSGAAYDGAI